MFFCRVYDLYFKIGVVVLNINIDYQSRVPIYEQVVLEIEKMVALGVLNPGDQISSIRDLACELGLNPNTIKKSYDTLEQKGVIISKSTKGTFITDNVAKVKDRKIDSIIDEVKEKIQELENIGLTKKEISKRLKL